MILLLKHERLVPKLLCCPMSESTLLINPPQGETKKFPPFPATRFAVFGLTHSFHGAASQEKDLLTFYCSSVHACKRGGERESRTGPSKNLSL